MHTNIGIYTQQKGNCLKAENNRQTFFQSFVSGLLKLFFISMLFLLIPGAETFAESLLPENLVIENEFQPGLGTPVGEVTLRRGKVVIIHENEKDRGYYAKKDLPLFKKDTIITLKKGRIRFRLNDGSILTLGSETKLMITQSIYDPNTATRSSFIDMITGKARFFIRKITSFKTQDFKVKTQTAVVGVRGSEYIIHATEDRTQVITMQDTDLNVFSLSALDRPVRVSDFEQTIIEKGKMPLPPQRISPEALRELDAVFDIPGDEADAGTMNYAVESPVREEEPVFSDETLINPEVIGKIGVNRFLKTESSPVRDGEERETETARKEVLEKEVIENTKESVAKPEKTDLPDFPVPP